MTAAMFDEMADREYGQRHNAALLRPGTLIFLWRPGDRAWHDGSQPVVARVKTGRRDTIMAVDTRDGAEAVYDVASDITQPDRLRWTWEVAAAPQARTVSSSGVERIDSSALDIEERVRLVCGRIGVPLLVRLKNGDAIRGVLTRLIMAHPEDREAEWVVFTGDRDAAGAIAHVVRAEEIAGFSRDPDA